MTRLRYPKTLAAGLICLTRDTCAAMRSSQSMGFAAAHCAFSFDQSNETMPNCAASAASNGPLELHAIVMVLMLMLYVGGHGGLVDGRKPCAVRASSSAAQHRSSIFGARARLRCRTCQDCKI